MTMLIAANNVIGLKYESGTYANATGASLQWVGEIQSHDLTPKMNVYEKRYIGGGTRDVQQFVDGPQDYEGKMTFHPQDFRMFVFALGSCVDAGSPSPYTHVISTADGAGRYNAYTSGTLNPFMSFTLEVAEKYSTGSNFIRTAVGAVVDQLTLKGTQGGLLEVDLTYVPQNVNFSSGASTAITEGTLRPLAFYDTKVHIPSGTTLSTVTDFSWVLGNKLDRKHYQNGSRILIQPTPTERLITLNVGCDANAVDTKSLYDQYFIGGSTFNAMLEVTCADAGAGSRDGFFIMSGCKMVDMANPDALEGINAQKLVIRAPNVVLNTDDTTQLYNPW